MRKLICIFGLGLSTLPAMAGSPGAGTHALLGKAAATSSSSEASSLPDLPLPPVRLGSSATVPGYGKATQAKSNTTDLPGLGTLSESSSNPGKGNGNAQYSGQLNIAPQSTQTPTVASANLSEPQAGQVSVDNKVQGAGFGKSSQSFNKTAKLPLGGTLDESYSNGGKGQSSSADLTYTSPAPKN